VTAGPRRGAAATAGGCGSVDILGGDLLAAVQPVDDLARALDGPDVRSVRGSPRRESIAHTFPIASVTSAKLRRQEHIGSAAYVKYGRLMFAFLRARRSSAVPFDDTTAGRGLAEQAFAHRAKGWRRG
jgi:hypothetical protein